MSFTIPDEVTETIFLGVWLLDGWVSWVMVDLLADSWDGVLSRADVGSKYGEDEAASKVLDGEIDGVAS